MKYSATNALIQFDTRFPVLTKTICCCHQAKCRFISRCLCQCVEDSHVRTVYFVWALQRGRLKLIAKYRWSECNRKKCIPTSCEHVEPMSAIVMAAEFVRIRLSQGCADMASKLRFCQAVPGHSGVQSPPKFLCDAEVAIFILYPC